MMVDLKQLHASDAPAVLSFELANRAYFAEFIPDRGDEFFDQFADRFSASLAEQEVGDCAFYLSVDRDGSVLGRFNLYALQDGAANLGYRVAQGAAGRGLATTAVRQLCRLAETHHGLHTLRAGTSDDNVSSQRVLTKAGFVPVGPADGADSGSTSGISYRRNLAPRVT